MPSPKKKPRVSFASVETKTYVVKNANRCGSPDVSYDKENSICDYSMTDDGFPTMEKMVRDTPTQDRLLRRDSFLAEYDRWDARGVDSAGAARPPLSERQAGETGCSDDPDSSSGTQGDRGPSAHDGAEAAPAQSSCPTSPRRSLARASSLGGESMAISNPSRAASLGGSGGIPQLNPTGLAGLGGESMAISSVSRAASLGGSADMPQLNPTSLAGLGGESMAISNVSRATSLGGSADVPQLNLASLAREDSMGIVEITRRMSMSGLGDDTPRHLHRLASFDEAYDRSRISGARPSPENAGAALSPQGARGPGRESAPGVDRGQRLSLANSTSDTHAEGGEDTGHFDCVFSQFRGQVPSGAPSPEPADRAEERDAVREASRQSPPSSGRPSGAGTQGVQSHRSDAGPAHASSTRTPELPPQPSGRQRSSSAAALEAVPPDSEMTNINMSALQRDLQKACENEESTLVHEHEGKVWESRSDFGLYVKQNVKDPVGYEATDVGKPSTDESGFRSEAASSAQTLPHAAGGDASIELPCSTTLKPFATADDLDNAAQRPGGARPTEPLFSSRQPSDGSKAMDFERFRRSYVDPASSSGGSGAQAQHRRGLGPASGATGSGKAAAAAHGTHGGAGRRRSSLNAVPPNRSATIGASPMESSLGYSNSVNSSIDSALLQSQSMLWPNASPPGQPQQQQRQQQQQQRRQQPAVQPSMRGSRGAAKSSWDEFLGVHGISFCGDREDSQHSRASASGPVAARPPQYRVGAPSEQASTHLAQQEKQLLLEAIEDLKLTTQERNREYEAYVNRFEQLSSARQEALKTSEMGRRIHGMKGVSKDEAWALLRRKKDDLLDKEIALRQSENKRLESLRSQLEQERQKIEASARFRHHHEDIQKAEAEWKRIEKAVRSGHRDEEKLLQDELAQLKALADEEERQVAELQKVIDEAEKHARRQAALDKKEYKQHLQTKLALSHAKRWRQDATCKICRIIEPSVVQVELRNGERASISQETKGLVRVTFASGTFVPSGQTQVHQTLMELGTKGLPELYGALVRRGWHAGVDALSGGNTDSGAACAEVAATFPQERLVDVIDHLDAMALRVQDQLAALHAVAMDPTLPRLTAKLVSLDGGGVAIRISIILVLRDAHCYIDPAKANDSKDCVTFGFEFDADPASFPEGDSIMATRVKEVLGDSDTLVCRGLVDQELHRAVENWKATTKVIEITRSDFPALFTKTIEVLRHFTPARAAGPSYAKR